MREICAEVKILLADNCPLAEKAFEKVTRGTVLGVGFDSERMEWYLSSCRPAFGSEADPASHGVSE